MSKAFDKTNHHALFIKLMHRVVPSVLLELLETWFASSITCVKWASAFSTSFNLTAGVRQGGVLSPTLFGIYIDDVAKRSAPVVRIAIYL